MAEYRRGILYGDALILAGVQASLSAFPDLDIITLEELPAGWVAILHELHPSAVIFDLDGVQPDLPLAILRQSNLMLIGIDPSSAGTLVLSSHAAHALSADDLVNVICQRDSMRDDAKGV